MSLETHVSTINQIFYLREFTFSKNKFTPKQKSQLEFSDNVLWLDDLLITLQIKERNLSNSHTVEKEIKWFQKKVLGVATKQVRDTLQYLKTYPKIEITNERGKTFNVVSADIKKEFHAVVYLPQKLLPERYKRKKFHRSKTAGFIHLFTVRDYEEVCRTLITPAEISEYLEFRIEICTKYEEITNKIPEQFLLGQFLKGDLDAQPHFRFNNYLLAFNQKFEDFDLSPTLHNFLEKTIRTIGKNFDYYKILKELAKLKRTELKLLKERLSLCVNNSAKGNMVKPYRWASSRTKCGFIVIPVPAEFEKNTLNILENLICLHKYEQKLDKCVGISVYWSGSYFDIGWCLIEGKWVYDKEMEIRFEKTSLLRKVKEEKIFTYHFGN